MGALQMHIPSSKQLKCRWMLGKAPTCLYRHFHAGKDQARYGGKGSRVFGSRWPIVGQDSLALSPIPNLNFSPTTKNSHNSFCCVTEGRAAWTTLRSLGSKHV